MKKQDLLKYLNEELLDKLYGFCYVRTNDSYEAQELCSDIVYALVKAAHTDGEIASLYPFVWRVAHNVYADFLSSKRKYADIFCDGDGGNGLLGVAAQEQEDDSRERLNAVYRRIAFLTKAYREVMILYYIDGIPTAEIAKRQNTSEGAVRQRLFAARKKVKSEVDEMAEMMNCPVNLDTIDLDIWGSGDPHWGDPRAVCTRMFSKHIVWLCRKRPMSASEIAKELNVPTVYVEEELEILAKGENGKYGLLRRMDSGKYAINFILLDSDAMEKAQALYTAQLPNICGIIAAYIEKHKEEYISFPYLNRKVELNLILWQQVIRMARSFANEVERVLAECYFSRVARESRPFNVFGFASNGKRYGGGWDSAFGENVCGYSKIRLENIYTTRIKPHFHCGLNVSRDPQIQLALRAIEGLDVSALSEMEKEHAAKAIQCGYLYREGDVFYTKILVSSMKDRDRLFDISDGLDGGFFAEEARAVADKIAVWIKKEIPDYLLSEWRFANDLANLPVLDFVMEVLIEKGILTPPEGGTGAEGCWMSVAAD